MNVFNGPIILRGHGKMPRDYQSKALVKLAEVVIKDWTINSCLKVHLGFWAGLCTAVHIHRNTYLVQVIVWSLDPAKQRFWLLQVLMPFNPNTGTEAENSSLLNLIPNHWLRYCDLDLEWNFFKVKTLWLLSRHQDETESLVIISKVFFTLLKSNISCSMWRIKVQDDPNVFFLQ